MRKIRTNLKREAQRIVRDMSYNASVLAKEQARNAEYNKRFENKAEGNK